MLKDLYRYNSKTPVSLHIICIPLFASIWPAYSQGLGLSKSRKGEIRFVQVTLFETTRRTLWQWRNCDESLWPLGGRGEHVRYQDVRGRPLSKWFCPLKAETSSIATSLRFSRCYFNFFAFVFLNFTQHSLFPGGASREGPIGRRDHSLRGRHGQYPGLRGEGICLLLFSFLWQLCHLSPLCLTLSLVLLRCVFFLIAIHSKTSWTCLFLAKGSPSSSLHAHAHAQTRQMVISYLHRGWQAETEIAKKWWYCMRTDKTTFRALRKSLAFIPSFFFQPPHVWQSTNSVEVLRSRFCAHTDKVESSWFHHGLQRFYVSLTLYEMHRNAAVCKI